MGAVMDPTAEAMEQGHGERGRMPVEENPSESSGVQGRATKSEAGASEGSVVNGAAQAGKPAIEFSPAPPRIHRGASGGMFRGGSGGIHRVGSAGGVGLHRGASGGLHRGRSHLPSLTSITFSMSRLPEDDVGLQMHLTQTAEVESPPGSPRAIGDDGDDAPTNKPSRLRKHLTVVGACSCSFRLAETVLSLVAIVVMCSNSQSMGGKFGTLRFNHFQAYNYLVAVNVCVFLYSTLQFILLAYTVILGISFIPSIFISTWLTFGFDQLFSYLLLSASTSAATVANMSYTGEMGVRLCSRYDLGSFCARADAAVTMSFFTFLAMLSSTILAMYRISILLTEY